MSFEIRTRKNTQRGFLVLWVVAKLGDAPPRHPESQISDLEVWDTGDVADRVLMSVKDVYLRCRSIPDTNRDVSGNSDL